MVWLRTLAAVVGIGGVGLFLLVALGPRVPASTEPLFDLDEVRQLAGDDGPDTLRTARVVAGIQSGALLRVGGSLARRPLPVYPVEMVYADGSSVLLEPATDDACSAGRLPLSFFDPDAYDRMQQAMRRARLILATHEHFDHICGLTRSPWFDELVGKALITNRQYETGAYLHEISDELRAEVTPVVVDGSLRVAPGVVVIEASGHTPGSIWVYVRQRSGVEWLFVGDTVWTEESITHGKAKPFVIALGGEDPFEHARQVRALMTLREEHPELTIVVAHEGPNYEAALAEGRMRPL